MSKPFLPGQNSKHWGYDLNNYLLSLDSRMSAIENSSATDTSILQASGVGFNGTNYKFMSIEGGVDKNNWTVEHIDLSNSYIKLAGAINFYKYESTGFQIKTQIFTETNPYIIFQSNNVFYTTVDSTTGKIAIPSESIQLDTNYIYYSVYLFFDEYSEIEAVRTVISPNYIFRGDMIMIGMLERDVDTTIISGKEGYNYTFIPRIFSSGKTLYETSRDTYQSYAAVENFNYDNSNDSDLYGPFAASFDFNLMTNGINAKEGGFALTPEVNKDNIILNKNSIDIISGKTGDRFLVDTQDGCGLSSFDNFEIVDRTYSYYLAPSGRLYIQESGVDATPSNTGDYTLELNNPLSRHPYFQSGALVYLGSAYIINQESSPTVVWCEAKQNGISPVILGSGNNNHYKTWIENQEFWFDGDKYFQIQLDRPNMTELEVQIYSKEVDNDNVKYSNIRFLDNIKLASRIENNNYTIYLNKGFNCYSDNNELRFAIESNNTLSSVSFYDYEDEASYIRIYGIGNCVNDNFKLTLNLYDDYKAEDQEWHFLQDGTFKTKKLVTQEEVNLSNMFFITPETSQIQVSSIFTVDGETSFSNKLNVTGDAVFSKITVNELSATGNTSLLNTTVTGDINITGATNYTSDIRLKSNITPINQNKCYEAVQRLDVSMYTYTTNNQDSLGLIAQDIEQILPEYAHILIHEDENGYKSVFEHKLLFILWEALKKEIKERKKLGGE